MKIFVLPLTILLLFLSSLQADVFQQRNVTLETKSTGQNGSTDNGARQVTFIFRASYTGNIGGQAFTSADVPLVLSAQSQDTLRAIPFTVTAGTLVIVVQK